jgi:hypothetical protein
MSSLCHATIVVVGSAAGRSLARCSFDVADARGAWAGLQRSSVCHLTHSQAAT